MRDADRDEPLTLALLVVGMLGSLLATIAAVRIGLPNALGLTVVSAATMGMAAWRMTQGVDQCDTLTGLPGRDRLGDLLTAAVTGRSGRGSLPAEALVVVDIDRFAVVNQIYGSLAGDQVLVATAATLQRSAGPAATVVRISGDEFGVLVPVPSQAEAALVAGHLKDAVRAQRVSVTSHSISVTVSVGLAMVDATTTPDEIIRRAAAARYTATHRGGDRVTGYVDGTFELDQMAADARWEREVREAMAEGRMRLVFQPVIDLRLGVVSHHEALVRLAGVGTTPGHLLEAHHFMPAVERVGLAAEVDQWVVRTAIEKVAVERAEGRHLRVGINLSAAGVADPGVLNAITVGLVQHRVNASSIEFEITETAAVEDVAQARRFIEQLRRLGCRFSLDDFGTGYSSLSYLRDIPTDAVKIDRSFITGLSGDAVAEGVVRALNELVHMLGKVTIAEGVEDAWTLETLQRLGVDFVQGWYVGRPDETPKHDADACGYVTLPRS